MKLCSLSLLLCLAFHLAAAQVSPRPLTAEQVVNNLVQRNLQRAAALHAYRSIRTYRIEYRGFPSSRSAEMVVDVKYRSPFTKEFAIRSESGSKLLVEKVLKRLLQSEQEAQNDENQTRIALNNENYGLKLLGNEPASTGLLYILFAEPRAKNKYLFRGKVWVDAENYNLLKVEAEPGNQADRLREELKSYRQSPRFLIYPMGRRPHGYRYNITFLNDLHELSLPDQVDVLRFTLDLQGQQEWESQTVLRYSGYQFFGVDVKDLFQVRK